MKRYLFFINVVWIIGYQLYAQDPFTFPIEELSSPQVIQMQVLTGVRVFDNITGRLLDDVYYESIPIDDLDSMVPLPRDDGVWPDLMKDDKIYSNFTETDQYIGPESNEAKRQIIRVLESADYLTPHEFFLIPATSTDPYSSLPFLLEVEEDKDERVKKWCNSFLRKFRQNPKDSNSNFWPIYVPRPPRKPSIDPPLGFIYFTKEDREKAEKIISEENL